MQNLTTSQHNLFVLATYAYSFSHGAHKKKTLRLESEGKSFALYRLRDDFTFLPFQAAADCNPMGKLIDHKRHPCACASQHSPPVW